MLWLKIIFALLCCFCAGLTMCYSLSAMDDLSEKNVDNSTYFKKKFLYILIFICGIISMGGTWFNVLN